MKRYHFHGLEEYFKSILTTQSIVLMQPTTNFPFHFHRTIINIYGKKKTLSSQNILEKKGGGEDKCKILKRRAIIYKLNKIPSYITQHRKYIFNIKRTSQRYPFVYFVFNLLL